MHILITGSQGFIGSYLIRALLDTEYSVCGLDTNSGSGPSGNYRLIKGNILDKDASRRAMDGVDCIVHLAAVHRDDGIPAREYFEVNEGGTRTLLECASDMGIDKFVFFSSAAVYGQPGKATEDNSPQPATPYGASKLEAEAAVKSWILDDPQRTAIIIRPAAIFGPKNYANIYRLISKVADGKFRWVGGGDNIKSVAYVENLVAAALFLIDRMKPGLETYNYSDEPQLTLKHLVNLISEKARAPTSRFHIPFSVAFLAGGMLDFLGRLLRHDFDINTARLRKFRMHSEYPADRIRSLGFHQRFTLEKGIEKTVHWYLNSR